MVRSYTFSLPVGIAIFPVPPFPAPSTLTLVVIPAKVKQDPGSVWIGGHDVSPLNGFPLPFTETPPLSLSFGPGDEAFLLSDLNAPATVRMLVTGR